MKLTKTTKLSALLLSALALTACGNLSNVSKDGTTENPVFPEINKSEWNHDGSQKGSWVNWDNVAQIEKGMNKDQLYNLIGRPHFAEGLFGVREWDYVFNYRENGVHKVCQYKVLFDKDMNVNQQWWLPNGCGGGDRVTYTLSGDFLFDFDKHNLTKQGEEVLKDLSGKIKEMTDVKEVKVAGYTDRLGSDSYNLALSKRRAETVANRLQELGVNNLSAVGMGESNQVIACADVKGDKALKECLRPNRRVEVSIFGAKVDQNSITETQQGAGMRGPSIMYQRQPFEHK